MAPRLLTTLRKSAAPFLPPPLLRFLHNFDSHSSSLGYNEASTAFILTAFLLAHFLRRLLPILPPTHRHKSPSNRVSVVLCGAAASGKTTLLHRILGNEPSPPPTVTSTLANIAHLPTTHLQIIDCPGHPSLESELPPLLRHAHRVVFALHSARSVVDAASLMYRTLAGREVLVACTASDARGAKNGKRIRIRVRNELERLRKVDLEVGVEGGELPRLYFVEVGWGSEGGVDAVREFVVGGVLPE